MTAPNYSPVPMPAPPAKPPRGRGLGVAALVLGLLAVVFSWIPFVNVIGIICGVVGLVLGLVGIFASHRWMSLSGAALCLLGIILGFAVTSVAARTIDEQLNTSPTVQEQDGSGQGETQTGATDTYEYKVTGSGQATIMYGSFSGSGVSTSSTTETLPWSKTISVTDKGVFFMPSLTVTATSGGTIACQVVHDGKVVASQSASGQYATVSCSGS